MLILSRKLGQTIIIGDDITVTVVGVRGEKIRLGITAPKGVSVHRSEVAAAIAAGVKQKVKGGQSDEHSTERP